jgi:hypothetical protein
LRHHVVDNIGVGAFPATQARASTEDTNVGKFTISSNTEDLLADSGRCIAGQSLFPKKIAQHTNLLPSKTGFS